MIEQRVVNGSKTELYISGGGNSFMTQAFPTNFHVFLTTKILSAAEEMANWIEVSAAERAKIEAEDAKWERPPQAFIDLWNEACKRNLGTVSDGCYNEATGYFELNGLKDITYEQALRIYIYSFNGIATSDWNGGDGFCQNYFSGGDCRTLFPIFIERLPRAFLYASNIKLEVVVLLDYYSAGIAREKLNPPNANYNPIDVACSQAAGILRTTKIVYGILNMKNDKAYLQHFYSTQANANFQEIWLYNIVKPIETFRANTALKFECWKYMIDNAINTDAIYITVHADVYSKLQGNGNYSDGNGTKEDWVQLNETAISKQISFATT